MSPARLHLALLARAVLPAVALCGCTEDLSQNVILVGVDGKYDSPFGVFLVLDDATYPYSGPEYHFTVDGRFASWDASTYVSFSPGGYSDLTVPAGSHVISLVDLDGHTLATSPSFEAKPAPEINNVQFRSSVVFYGTMTNLTVRVLVDDAATLPDGVTHVRVMSLLADHQPVGLVQCPTATAIYPPYTASACSPVGGPVAYGDVFEMDASAALLDRLGFSLSPSAAVDPAVGSFTNGAGATGSSSRFVTRIATQQQGPANPCPTCLFTVQ